jgi:hypothetical protein
MFLFLIFLFLYFHDSSHSIYSFLFFVVGGNMISHSVKRPIVEEEIEVLLECVGRTDSKIVFKYHLSDRRDAMAQSMLSKETEFFTSHIDNDIVSMKDYRGKDIKFSAVFFIGKNVLDYIRQYLEYKGNDILFFCCVKYMYYSLLGTKIMLMYICILSTLIYL